MLQRGQALGQNKGVNMSLNCCGIILIIVIAVILNVYDGDCDSPIRLWLNVEMFVMVA